MTAEKCSGEVRRREVYRRTIRISTMTVYRLEVEIDTYFVCDMIP